MASPKETIHLPAIRERTPSVYPLADNLKGSLHPSIEAQSTRDFIVKHNVKRLSIWFKTWHAWQQRILVCHMMKHCSKQHLEFLATSLEPILHLDFSSSLVPHMKSLHWDGVAMFQIHRCATKHNKPIYFGSRGQPGVLGLDPHHSANQLQGQQ